MHSLIAHRRATRPGGKWKGCSTCPPSCLLHLLHLVASSTCPPAPPGNCNGLTWSGHLLHLTSACLCPLLTHPLTSLPRPPSSPTHLVSKIHPPEQRPPPPGPASPQYTIHLHHHTSLLSNNPNLGHPIPPLPPNSPLAAHLMVLNIHANTEVLHGEYPKSGSKLNFNGFPISGILVLVHLDIRQKVVHQCFGHHQHCKGGVN